MNNRENHGTSSTVNCFHETLEYEFRRAARYGTELTLMFIKLGRLDAIGRLFGDSAAADVFWEVDRIIRNNIRFADRKFVHGEDELMIILPHTSKERACCMISKLKQVLENYQFTHGNEGRMKLVPMFGIASYPHDVGTMVGAMTRTNESCGA